MANDAAQLAKCINTAIAMTTMIAPAINSRQPPGRFLTFPQCGQVGADELTSRPHSEQLVSAIMSTGYGRNAILTRQPHRMPLLPPWRSLTAPHTARTSNGQ